MNLVWLDISASYSHSSLALPAIEACREGDSYEWSCVRGTINSDPFLLTKELCDSEPTIIASTLWLFNHEVVLKVCERIKSLLPDVDIVLGGPEFNGDNEPFLRRHTSISHAFRGECEHSFHKYLRGDNPASIEGLCYIDSMGVYHDNGASKVADFASLPTPESSEFFSFDSPFVQLESSRGCFNSCAFCVSGDDKPIRIKSLEQIAQRIEYIRSRGVRDIRILDRTFNYSMKRATEMLQLFTKFEGMNFHLEIHPALLTDDLCSLLESMPMGLVHLEAGMQSLDDRVLEACGRVGDSRASMLGLSRLCAMTNFETHADLIAGLPHYTLEQIFSDVRSLAMADAAEIQLELLKLLPGTAMRHDAPLLGIRYSPTPPYEVLETPAISISELNRARLLSKLLDRFYNAALWRDILRQMIADNASFLPQFLDSLIESDLLDKPLSQQRCGSLLYDFCREWCSGRYLDDVSLLWVESGMSMRRKEAGNIHKATQLPPSLIREPNVHYYLWQGASNSYIICFDRSKDHSRASARIKV